MVSSSLPLRLVALGVLVFLTVPRMAQPGMFGDGLLYATVARNLSIGVGSVWAPTYTSTTWAQFFEHPPLGFALQAAAFWLLGDHLFVERLYSIVVLGLHALVLMAIWRRLQPAAYDWLPVLFWSVPSIVTWAAINNMLENTQGLLTSAAVLLLVSARSGTAPRVTLCGAGAGLAIVGAVLTKGPVGLFPLAAPAILLCLPRALRPAKLGLRTIAMIATIALCAAALAAYEPSRDSLTRYFETQVAPSIQGEREINSERVPVFRHVAVGIVARMSALLALLWAFGRRRVATTTAPTPSRVPALVFLGLALCASVPIAFSPKLAGHYFVPSVPMFALGFASLALRPAAALAAYASRPTGRRALFACAGVLLAASVLVPLLHGPMGRRDAALMQDLEALAPVIPRAMTIGSCDHPRAAYDWCLHSYVQRWYRVSLDARDAPVNGWLLQTEDGPCRARPRSRDGEGAAATASCQPPPSCRPVVRGDALALFRCDP